MLVYLILGPLGLIAVQTVLGSNAKIVVPSNTEQVNAIAELAGVLPLGRTNGESRKPQRTTPPEVEPYSALGTRPSEVRPIASR